jgi:hypothetical protein
MKTALYSLALSVFFILPVRADLTITYSSTVQSASQTPKDQKAEATGTTTNMTVKIKGDKARIDASPHIITIFDGKTGELINLLNDQKTIVRISADKMKAVTDMLDKFTEKKGASEKPKLVPTGRKETVNGYATEEYTYAGPHFKATYWIAPDYPNGAAILAQLGSVKSEFWNAANARMPDFRDFPGLPIRTRMTIGEVPAGHPMEITTTITSVSEDPITESEFTVPSDFKETRLPDIFSRKNAAPAVSPNP